VQVRKPVSPDPIQLAIYSPTVPNLTMVDMPGAQLVSCVRSLGLSFYLDQHVRTAISTLVCARSRYSPENPIH